MALGPLTKPVIVETVYPRKKEVPRGFLEAVVGDTRRQVESRRVEAVVSSGNVEHDLLLALEVRNYPSSAQMKHPNIL